jgi:hypothetical protein
MINQVGVKAECTSGCRFVSSYYACVDSAASFIPGSGQVHFVVCIDRHIRVEETFYN